MSEYEPGTVAVATVRGVEGVRAYRHDDWWATVTDVGGYVTHGDDKVTDVRPLVVLDLANRTTAEDVARALRENDYGWIADQIEAQTKPPKPPEPTGLGAVVEDADGETWVRVNVCTGTAEWRCTDAAPVYLRYRNINAVRVLSEGVTE